MATQYVKTPEMEAFVSELAVKKPDWDKVKERLMGEKESLPSDASSLQGHFFETVVHSALEDLCSSNDSRVYNPKAQYLNPTSLSYVEKNGRVELRYGNEGYIEIDAVVRIGEYPLLIEVKPTLVNKAKPFNNERRDFRLGELVNSSYKDGGQFGYVMILSPNKVNPSNRKQSEFMGRNGMIIPNYARKNQGVRDMERVFSELNIPLPENPQN